MEWTGTNNGPLSGPFGTIQPTGKVGKVAAAQVACFEEDKICEIHHYFDLMTVLRQMGVGPQPEARAGA